MNILDEIIAHKRTEVEKLMPRLEKLRAAATLRNDFRSFADALRLDPSRLGMIAEVKRGSPSAGTIAKDFDPLTIARGYEKAGATALSILTDEKYFQGHLNYLSLIREQVDIPCLRKDFIIHEAQIYEAVVAGADAILLIGPEGDFTPKEIDAAIGNGFLPVTLGDSRLRTETAGVVGAVLMKI